MKVLTKFLLSMAALAVTSAPSWAATCGDGVALSTYLGAGFSCTIGDKTFSNFTYTFSPGAPVGVPAANVTVDTIGPGADASFTSQSFGLPAGLIGLEFSAGWSAGSGQNIDSLIGFTLSVTGGGPAQIEDAALVQGGSGITGDGIGTVAENACGPAPCVPGTINLNTVDSSTTVALSKSVTFTPTGSIQVSKDINVKGNDGTASISQVIDAFSQTVVPIPGALPLFATGLVGLWGLRRRRSKQSAVAAA